MFFCVIHCNTLCMSKTQLNFRSSEQKNLYSRSFFLPLRRSRWILHLCFLLTKFCKCFGENIFPDGFNLSSLFSELLFLPPRSSRWLRGLLTGGLLLLHPCFLHLHPSSRFLLFASSSSGWRQSRPLSPSLLIHLVDIVAGVRYHSKG